MGRVTERYLLPEHPVDSIDEYLATDIGGLGVRARPATRPDGDHRRGHAGPGCAAAAAAGSRPVEVGGRRRQPAPRRYLVCNGAEGEPGTFKDRALLRANPYQLVEGLVIAAFAVGADRGVHLPQGQLRARRSTRSPEPSRSSRPRASARDCRSTSSPAPTSTCSARRRRCSR